MKKKFLLGTMVPALAAAAVIGSGFSLWVFDALTKTNDAQAMEKTITQFAQIGEIKEASKITITFDQTADGRKTATGNQSVSTKYAEGITLSYANETKAAIYTAPTNDGLDYLNGVLKCDFTTTITISEDLNKYLVLTYNGDTLTSDAGVYTYKFSKTQVEATTTVFDWEKLALKYATGNEPTNVTDYKKLQEAVNNSTITVTYNATVSIIESN